MNSRITAIANTRDAITSDLPYRQAQSVQVARREIEAGAGGQFDPEIVKVFLAMSPSIWEDLRRQINAQIRASSNSNR